MQAATFMAAIGPEAAVIYGTFELSDDNKKEVKQLEKAFEEYFSPASNITFERYSFNKITQQSEETFDDFLTKIKTQAVKCNFGVLCDSLVKDKIVRYSA